MAVMAVQAEPARTAAAPVVPVGRVATPRCQAPVATAVPVARQQCRLSGDGAKGGSNATTGGTSGTGGVSGVVWFRNERPVTAATVNCRWRGWRRRQRDWQRRHLEPAGTARTGWWHRRNQEPAVPRAQAAPAVQAAASSKALAGYLTTDGVSGASGAGGTGGSIGGGVRWCRRCSFTPARRAITTVLAAMAATAVTAATGAPEL